MKGKPMKDVPIFPVVNARKMGEEDTGIIFDENGATLNDLFAGLVVASLVTKGDKLPHYAKVAYEVADLMMEERERRRNIRRAKAIDTALDAKEK